ncbi:MAG: helix-turn-helix domain-containing protein [Lachnospira eligens]
MKKYETDNRNPKLEQLEKIAAALDVSVFEFLDIEVKSISDIHFTGK